MLFASAEELQDCFYAAASDYGCWSRFLAGLTELFDGNAASLDWYDPKTGAVKFSAVHGLNPDDLAAMAEHLASDPRDRVALRFPSKPLIVQELIPEAEWKASGMYQHVFRPMNLEHHLAAFVPVNAGIAILSVFRPPGSKNFAAPDCDRFGAFIPHLRRVVRLQEEFMKLEHERWSALAVLDDMMMGVVVCDPGCRPLFANRYARQRLDGAPGLQLKHGEIWASEVSESAQLRTLIRDCIRSNEPAALRIQRGYAQTPLQVRINPIPVAPGKATRPAPDRVAVLYIIDPDQPQETRPDLLQRLFGFTAAEARFAAQLADGLRLTCAAEKLGVTENTARSTLKQLMAKTQTSRQAELVKMLIAAPGWR